MNGPNAMASVFSLSSNKTASASDVEKGGSDEPLPTLNIFTCANRPYEDFTPLFAAACLWSNPGVSVEVGVEDRQTFMEMYGRAIDAIHEHTATKSIVIRNGNFFDSRGRAYLPNSVRFITPPEVISDYVYISDIDIITLENDILDQHLRHMARTGLPFSNLVTQSNNWHRLSGLHFTKYEALYPLPEHADLLTTRMNDEALLYKLVERKVGSISIGGEKFRPVHGIHVSPNRSPYYFQTWDGRTKPGWLHYYGRSYQERWRGFKNSPLFQGIAPYLSERMTNIVSQIDNFDPKKLYDFSAAKAAVPAVPVAAAASTLGHLSDLVTVTGNPPVGGVVAANTTGARPLNPRLAMRLKRNLYKLMREEKWEEARAIQAKHLVEYPYDAESQHRMGHILAKMGDISLALDHTMRAHASDPTQPAYASALARLYARLNDRANALAFRRKAAELEPGRRQVFEQEQASVKASALAIVRVALARCLATWRYAETTAPGSDTADRLITKYPSDQTPLWARYIPQKYKAGEVATLEEIGKFMIPDPNQTIHNRLSRGIPWELPAVALFMELASRCIPTALFVDIGANVGALTVPMARTFKGTVLAIEPFAVTYELLLQNLALNSIANCIPLQKACSATSGKGQMTRVVNSNLGKARLDRSSPGEVEITTLDDEVERIGRPVALMKIDVEGHEADVLEGAMETIRRDRPIIFCEILDEARAAVLAEKLSVIGYELRHFLRHDWIFVPK